MIISFKGAILNVGKVAFNGVTSKVRATVEWIIKVKMYFTTVNFKREMKIRQAAMGALHLYSTLLCNFQTCTYLNEVAQYFNCAPCRKTRGSAV